MSLGSSSGYCNWSNCFYFKFLFVFNYSPCVCAHECHNWYVEVWGQLVRAASLLLSCRSDLEASNYSCWGISAAPVVVSKLHFKKNYPIIIIHSHATLRLYFIDCNNLLNIKKILGILNLLWSNLCFFVCLTNTIPKTK